ncbi:DUF1579 domain-containing protein [Haliangium ochraceum]|nr:DUF1579 domain-containing protein [Haliangium ochraceum]
MSKASFATSMQPGGVHHTLAQMVGTWRGRARTWFEPEVLADESDIRGTIRPALEGRFLIHEYSARLQDKPFSGIALLGYHVDLERFETAWVDSFHTGTSIMFSHGARAQAEDQRDMQLTALGSYAVPGSEPWGWRTEIHQPEQDHLIITYFNLMPGGGAESKAVEFDYRRDAP